MIGIEGRKEGLRERKKQRTRDQISRAAFDLFDRQGYQETTIAQIAELADVSPRTVSSYFPAKEDLVFESFGPFEQKLSDALADRPEGQDTMEALRVWIFEERKILERKEEQLARLHRLIDGDEHLSSIHRARIHRLERLIAEGIAQDLGLPPDHVEPRMAAAAAAAVFDLLDDEDRGGEACVADKVDRRRQFELVDQALTFVSGGIQALRAGRDRLG